MNSALSEKPNTTSAREEPPANRASQPSCRGSDKADRVSRSLADFEKLVAVFDRNCVTVLAVTQPLNATMSVRRQTPKNFVSSARFITGALAEIRGPPILANSQ